MRWLSAVAGVALIGLAVVLFTGWVPWAWSVQERRDQADAAVVRLDLGSGDVTVRPGDVQRIGLVARSRAWWGATPDQGWRTDGDTLVLGGCGWRCSVDYELVVPEGTRVEGETGSGTVRVRGASEVRVTVSSGDIELRDVTGRVDATTSSGDVLLERVGGPATVHSSSGSVTGRDLAGPVDASTSSGDIAVDLNRQQDLRADTSSGDVEVSVPAGAYRVDTDGDRDGGDVEVIDDPDARYALTLSTSSGSIAVRER